MIKELRKLRVKDKSKAAYIATLIHRGKLPIHFSKNGYVAYDTDELRAYKATVKIGRPTKAEIRYEE